MPWHAIVGTGYDRHMTYARTPATTTQLISTRTLKDGEKKKDKEKKEKKRRKQEARRVLLLLKYLQRDTSYK